MSNSQSLLQAVSHLRVFTLPEAWGRTAEFYKMVLGLEELHADSEAGVSVYKCGEGPLIILERVHPNEKEDAGLASRFAGISFQVADMRAAFEELTKRGVQFIRPPESTPWGGMVTHFNDPAGNTLTIVQERDGV